MGLGHLKIHTRDPLGRVLWTHVDVGRPSPCLDGTKS